MNIKKSKKTFINRCSLLGVVFFIGSLFMANAFAEPSKTKLAVWVSETAVFTYTFDFKNFVKQQKEIAKYFTADGWIGYSKALIESKLPEDVKKNSYYVSSIPTMPPTIKKIGDNRWEGTVNLLVIYKNPVYKQKQNLKVVIYFEKSEKLGVNGFAVSSMKSIVTEPPCRCSKATALVAIV
ncbi:MAG: DotI/IcmL family type IV secretion protein [Legionellaceae bacterium]|nr:DotI/IcmL family type IV secretion protein [Legionellaceae bacterium]